MAANSAQVVKFLDVGHGDSSIIYLEGKNADSSTVVIDVPQSDKLLQELAVNGKKIIDLLVITHSDADHCKGINDFLEKFLLDGRVLKICFNIDRHKPTLTMKLFLKKFMEYYKKYGIQLVSGINDTAVSMNKIIGFEDVSFSILYPDTNDSARTYLTNNVNDMSIVCMLSNDNYNILFTGDLGPEGWSSVFQKNPQLRCDILKMPHHGAYYNSGKNTWGTKEIVEQLQPQMAIISTGENKNYNHPKAETIQILVDRNIKVYCTEYTSLCNKVMKNYSGRCYGDISIIRIDKGYRVETQKDNRYGLSTPACM